MHKVFRRRGVEVACGVGVEGNGVFVDFTKGLGEIIAVDLLTSIF
jgi:hypothetical protein